MQRLGMNQKRKASVFVYAKREGRGKTEKDRGSAGSRDDRKSREEGCGGFVFMGREDMGSCGFVHQQL